MNKTTLKQLKPGALFRTTLKQLKQGALFRLKDSESSPIWVRNHYDRSSKTYACYKYEDYNHETFFKGTRTVFTY